MSNEKSIQKADIQTMDIKSIFSNEEVQKRFQSILGKKSAGFIVSVINAVTNNKDLATADRNSILFAAATAATLDLPINPNLGFAYIVPYKQKRKELVDRNGKQVEVWTENTLAQFQMGYKGFIQLAMRTGQVKTISATPIFEGELIGENRLTGFEFDFTRKISEKVIGYASYISLINGFEKIFYMTLDEAKKHGLKYSQSYKYDQQKGKSSSRWSMDFDSMAQKTVLKLLLSKYAPLSIEMQKAISTDQAVIGDWEGEVLDYPDNKPQTVEEVSKEKEEERITQFIKDAKTTTELTQAEDYVMSLGEDHEIYKLFTNKLDALEAKDEN